MSGEGGETRLQRIWEECEVALCCQVIGLITQRVETIRRPPEVAAVSRQLEHVGELPSLDTQGVVNVRGCWMHDPRKGSEIDDSYW